MEKLKPKKSVIVIMGVSGSGKTTIGKKLSEKTGFPFYDADDFHPQENIEKMKNGIPLNTEDRLPWLHILANKIEGWSKKNGGIIACSALKENYREILSSKFKSISWVYLSGSKNLIQTRMEQRQGHFMKTHLLDSQFDDLEIPNYGIPIDINQTPTYLVEEIISKLKLYG